MASIGLGHALPALVAVHGVVAAADRRDRDRRRQRLRQAREVVPRRSRRRVAAVGEGVHHGRHARVARGFRRARRRDPDANARRRATPGRSGGRCRRFAAARSIRPCSAGALSISPRAIASSMRGRSCITTRPAPMLRWPTSELPICPGGRPTSAARGAQEGVRTARPQPVEGGRARLADGVVGRIVAPAPAVEHDQHHRTAPLHRNVPRVLSRRRSCRRHRVLVRRVVWDRGFIVNRAAPLAMRQSLV